MHSWYYAAAGGQQHGPLPAADLADLARSGAIGPQTLVWRDGLAGWTALGEVAAELGLPPMQPPPALQAGPYAAPLSQAATHPAPVVQPVPTHLVWGIVTTLLCCWPLGVVSIVFACRVDRHRAEGDLAAALEASRKAGLWAFWSAMSMVIVLAVFFLFAIVVELLK